MNKTKELKYYNLSIFSLVILTVLAIITNRFLYADGSAFFYNILNKNNFHAFDNARILAQYILQTPLVISMKYFAIENKDTLAYIFGASLYIIPFTFTLLSIKLLENKKLYIFPLLSYVFSTIYSYTFIISEAHIIASLFWLILVLLLRKSLNLHHKLLLVIAFTLSSHMYESNLFFSILFIAIIVYKIKTNQQLFWYLILILIFYNFYISINSVLYPRDPNNSGNFQKAIGFILFNSHMIWLMIVIFIITLITSFQEKYKLIIFSIFILYFYFFPQAIEITKSYNGRVLLTIVPFILGVVYALYVYFGNFQNTINKFILNIQRATSCVVLLFVAYHSIISLQWYGYLNIFKANLLTIESKSIVDYRETLLGRKNLDTQIISDFGWDWTYPFMSYIISKGVLSTVIVNNQNKCCMNNPEKLLSWVSPNENIFFNSNKIKFHSWSFLENQHRWSIGKNSSISFNIKNIDQIRGELILNVFGLIDQNVKVYLNNNYIQTFKLKKSGNSEVIFFDKHLLNMDNSNTFMFVFSKPMQPSNGDKRVLAMGLKSFSIK
ncbi:hypothetical protein NG767_07950 [Aliarcobacter cryaerophilus]|uniref:hypothetical protein n=1 Tax=Aliarcobacter cryaerophilus TaxID=28198 RepID=UPI003DA411C9